VIKTLHGASGGSIPLQRMNDKIQTTTGETTMNTQEFVEKAIGLLQYSEALEAARDEPYATIRDVGSRRWSVGLHLVADIDGEEVVTAYSDETPLLDSEGNEIIGEDGTHYYTLQYLLFDHWGSCDEDPFYGGDYMQGDPGDHLTWEESSQMLEDARDQMAQIVKEYANEELSIVKNDLMALCDVVGLPTWIFECENSIAKTVKRIRELEDIASNTGKHFEDLRDDPHGVISWFGHEDIGDIVVYHDEEVCDCCGQKHSTYRVETAYDSEEFPHPWDALNRAESVAQNSVEVAIECLLDALQEKINLATSGEWVVIRRTLWQGSEWEPIGAFTNKKDAHACAEAESNDGWSEPGYSVEHEAWYAPQHNLCHEILARVVSSQEWATEYDA